MDVAQYLTQNPNAYQPAQHQLSVREMPSQGHSNPEVEELRAMVLNMQAQQTVVPVIEAFADGKPDFGALQEQIEQILSSGIIEKLHGKGLSMEQKLSESYRMAGGQHLSSRSESEAALGHSAPPVTERPVNPDAGTKSVRGAPADGFDPSTEDTDTDIESILRKEMRRLRS